MFFLFDFELDLIGFMRWGIGDKYLLKGFYFFWHSLISVFMVGPMLFIFIMPSLWGMFFRFWKFWIIRLLEANHPLLNSSCHKFGLQKTSFDFLSDHYFVQDLQCFSLKRADFREDYRFWNQVLAKWMLYHICLQMDTWNIFSSPQY